MNDELLIEFSVLGTPEPRGSKDAFPLYRAPRWMKRPVRRQGGQVTCKACGETNGGIIVNVSDANPKSDAWMETVRKAARSVWKQAPAGECALAFEFVFYVKRPKDHWLGKLLRDLVVAFPITRPDASKYARAVEDALTGIVWDDDAQITDQTVRKRYAVPSAESNGEGVIIRVWRREIQIAQQLPMDERVRVLPDESVADESDGQTALVA